MDNITKQQLILVCLLVAIVTAVATSVSTVSLMDTSSSPRQTIYRVIEKSIEKVAESPAVQSIVGTSPAKPETIVLSPSSIADTKSDSMVRIYQKTPEGNKFAALGVAIGSKNKILASGLNAPYVEGNVYVAVTGENKEVSLKFEKGGVLGSFNIFGFEYLSTDKKVAPLVLKSGIIPKLGENVVSLGGKESGDVVSTGIITELRSSDITASSTKDLVYTDITLTTNISGWLLFDTSGNVVAVEKMIDETSTPVFLSSKVVYEGIKEYL